jgi:CheY-like chemotaxis protein
MKRPAQNPPDKLNRPKKIEVNDRAEMASRKSPADVQTTPGGPRPQRTVGQFDSGRLQDRRRFPRARIAGTAIALVGGRYVGAFLVRDLSAGGACLLGDNNLTIGQVVQILLRVGDQLQSLEAEVVRRERSPSDEQSFAVAFRNLATEIEDSLQNLALLAIESAKVKKEATVLVLKSPSRIVADLDNDLRAIGYDVAAAATPLDAISLLSGDTHRIVAVVVGCDLACADLPGFLNFLRDAYPQIRRVALSGDSRPTQLERAITSGLVEAVLRQPWDSDSLSEALRPSGS